jgi:hypothetical protein
MPTYRLLHRHQPNECSTAYAAWKGYESPLRGRPATSSCSWGGHEIWWDLKASDPDDALRNLPGYLSDRAVATRVGKVEIP